MNSKHKISAAFKALTEMPKCVSADISYRIDINPWMLKGRLVVALWNAKNFEQLL